VPKHGLIFLVIFFCGLGLGSVTHAELSSFCEDQTEIVGGKVTGVTNDSRAWVKSTDRVFVPNFDSTNPHEILGLRPTDGPEEATLAAKQIAKRIHPDVNSGDKTAQKKTIKINNALDAIKKKEAEVATLERDPLDSAPPGFRSAVAGWIEAYRNARIWEELIVRFGKAAQRTTTFNDAFVECVGATWTASWNEPRAKADAKEALAHIYHQFLNNNPTDDQMARLHRYAGNFFEEGVAGELLIGTPREFAKASLDWLIAGQIINKYVPSTSDKQLLETLSELTEGAGGFKEAYLSVAAAWRKGNKEITPAAEHFGIWHDLLLALYPRFEAEKPDDKQREKLRKIAGEFFNSARSQKAQAAVEQEKIKRSRALGILGADPRAGKPDDRPRVFAVEEGPVQIEVGDKVQNLPQGSHVTLKLPDGHSVECITLGRNDDNGNRYLFLDIKNRTVHTVEAKDAKFSSGGKKVAQPMVDYTGLVPRQKGGSCSTHSAFNALVDAAPKLTGPGGEKLRAELADPKLRDELFQRVFEARSRGEIVGRPAGYHEQAAALKKFLDAYGIAYSIIDASRNSEDSRVRELTEHLRKGKPAVFSFETLTGILTSNIQYYREKNYSLGEGTNTGPFDFSLPGTALGASNRHSVYAMRIVDDPTTGKSYVLIKDSAPGSFVVWDTKDLYVLLRTRGLVFMLDPK
jgi:hypothetical protein